MQPGYDPAHGPLCGLIGHLSSLEADMIASDLRDLRIPAFVRRGHEPEATPATEGAPPAPVTGFEIVVPEAFVAIANEVLDVTHLRREGDATDAEIVRALAASEQDEPETGPATLGGTDDRGFVALRVGLVAIPVVLAILWQILCG